MSIIKKIKILNDPVYGFISIPEGLVFQLMEHPYFQRLRRIAQLGLTYYVYPGAIHNRFQHTLGALHLMGQAVEVLRSKGIHISAEEEEAVSVGILMHDIGHGPFSHTLETVLIQGVSHEFISVCFMNELNTIFKGKLALAIDIFLDKYHKKFLHQLISSQLDVDRLDYLKRDSFFTGVHEGVIASDRLINMLNVVNDHLVIEEKGIYSVEKFLVSRRLMYWQVYLHKTVLSAEYMLINILKRAKYLATQNIALNSTPALHYFLYHQIDKHDFEKNTKALDYFALLDDVDIFSAVKMWTQHPDLVLSELCKRLVNRNLYKIKISNTPIEADVLQKFQQAVMQSLKINEAEVPYFVFSETAKNNAYDKKEDNINILYKNGDLKDIAEASDHMNINVLSGAVVKYFLCYLPA